MEELELRKKIADEIPLLFIKWRQEIDAAYKAKKSAVLLSFPTWLAEELKK